MSYFHFLQPILIYLQFYKNKITVTRLDNGKSITRMADPLFSSERMILADFTAAETLVRFCIGELVRKKMVSKPLSFVIQVIEGFEGGLSNVELRSYRDSAMFSGATRVGILWGSIPLETNEALEVIPNQQVSAVKGMKVFR